MYIKPDEHELSKDIEKQIVFRQFIGEEVVNNLMIDGVRIQMKDLTKEFRLKRGRLCNGNHNSLLARHFYTFLFL